MAFSRIELAFLEMKNAKKNFCFFKDRTRDFWVEKAKKTNFDIFKDQTRVLGDQIYKKKYFIFFKDRTLAFSHTQPPKLKKSTYSVHVHHQMEAFHTAKHKEWHHTTKYQPPDLHKAFLKWLLVLRSWASHKMSLRTLHQASYLKDQNRRFSRANCDRGGGFRALNHDERSCDDGSSRHRKWFVGRTYGLQILGVFLALRCSRRAHRHWQTKKRWKLFGK